MLRSKFIIYAIALALPTYLIRFKIVGIPFTLLEILIFLSVFIKFLETKNLKWLRSPYNIPIVLLLVAGILSILISPDKKAALGLYKAYIIEPILVYLIAKDFTIEEKLNTTKLFVLSGVYVALHAFYQYFTGDLTPDKRVIGIFGYSPNYLGLYMAPILVGGFILFFTQKKLIYKLIWLISVILTGSCLYLADSRASIVSAIVGVITFFIINFREKIFKNKLAIIALTFIFAIGCLFLYKSFAPNFNLGPQVSNRITSSSNIRMQIWSTTLEIIRQKPVFGIGLGNYQNYFSDLTKNRVNFPEYITPWALTPHNTFLAFWINLGLLGLVAFIWILAIFVKRSTLKTTAGIISLSLMAVIVINGLFDTSYWKNDLALIFWLMIAIF